MDEYLANQTVDVRMQTDLGGVNIRLRGDIAPVTVENFCRYMDNGDFDGTFFHRNIPGFVAQAGGFKFNPDDGTFFGDGTSPIPENDPIVNEAGLPRALSNIAGTLAMAKKAGDPDSATSQWFFNVVDNSGEPPNGLDFQNGGFTVFAQVLGDDIAVVEDINAQDVCRDIPGLGTVACGDNADTIQIGASRPGSGFEPDNLLVVNYVGIDSDTDGIVDGVEAAAPDADVDMNGTLDVNQANVASFDNITGEYVALLSADGTALQSTDVLSPAYAIAHPAASFCFFKDLDLTSGFVGTEITGATPGGATTVDLIMPVGVLPDTFYNYGLTPGDPEPHWYEFLYDGETGAQISGSSVQIHYVDGNRGDNDLDNSNGIIATITGPAFTRTELREEDGILDFTEDGGPNNGDANDDGVKDSEQAHVATFPDLNSVFLTLVSDSATLPLQVVDANAQVGIPGDDILDTLDFTHGFVRFDVCADTVVSVDMTLPAGETADTFYLFGPTATNPEPTFNEFLYDGETGAEISDNTVTLHFVDGGRGDADMLKNGVIVVSPGGPAKRQGDADGVANEVEDAAPNNGDGNNDGIADSTQSHVASLPDIRNSYLTIEANPSLTLRSLNISDGIDFLSQAEPLSALNGLNFVYGFLSFEVANVDIGGNADIKIRLPRGESAKKFFKFGPTPDTPVDHLYEFTFDGETGAEISGNEVILHFVDGKRGDSDLVANGVITDPGTPALQSTNSGSGSGGGGGCSLHTEGAHFGQAGAWWLLLGIACLYGGLCRYRKY
jgi:cyclophilin family peptidyl-prolyl cis-trans isomerase